MKVKSEPTVTHFPIFRLALAGAIIGGSALMFGGAIVAAIGAIGFLFLTMRSSSAADKSAEMLQEVDRAGKGLANMKVKIAAAEIN